MEKASAWPKVTYEHHPWPPSASYGTSRRSYLRHRGPYLAAVPPLIADLTPTLDREANRLAEEALQELVRFDAEATFGYDRGEFGPLASVLLRSESASSSQIENLTSSARQIAVASLGETATTDAALIHANTRAMEAAIKLASSLDQEAIISMQRALMGAEALDHWREQQVWIGGSGLGPHEAQFVPPHHTRVPAYMADLERFMQRTDLPVLPHAAILHAQFETVHPFPDGNGRTGRALLQAFLRAKGVIHSVTVPISAGLLTNSSRYFASLGSYRAGDPDEIVATLSDAVFEATANARQLRDDLATITAGWRARLSVRADSVAWRVLHLLPQQPVINAKFVSDKFGVSEVAAQSAIGSLAGNGIVREFTGRKRGRLWVADEIVGSLDDFAARTGKRALGD